MKKLKKGDIVERKSHGKDILFKIEKIVTSKDKYIAILSGITIRILADAPIEDLELVAKCKIQSEKEELDKKLKTRIEKYSRKITTKRFISKKQVYTGKILHLDGDKKYTDKSYKYYKKMGLNSIVKYIPEYKQPIFIKQLLERYNPDILIITRS